jgi:hypothetical protein
VAVVLLAILFAGKVVVLVWDQMIVLPVDANHFQLLNYQL